MKKIISLLIICSIGWSCTQSEKDLQLMPIDYLTGGNAKSWKLVQLKNADENQLSECLKDDKFTFYKKSGKYEWLKGGSKCETEDSDTSFDFNLAVDGSSIIINEYEYKVNKLDMNTLEIEIVFNQHKQILTYSTQN